MWEPFKHPAVALYPYSSPISGHLNLITGDILETLQRNGEYVLARCKSTSCLGICPFSFLSLTDTPSTRPLVMETTYLLKTVFSDFLSSSKVDSRIVKVIDSTKKLLDTYPKLPTSSTAHSRHLDELRFTLGLPRLERNSRSEILTTHELQTKHFYIDPETAATESQSVYPDTIDLNMFLLIDANRPLRLSVRIYSTNDGRKVPCITNEFYDHPTSRVVIKNLDPKLLDSMVLVVKAFTYQRFNEGPYASEYLGTAVEPLYEKDIRIGGSEVALISSFYQIPFSDDYQSLLDKNPEIKRNDELPLLSIRVSAVPRTGEASEIDGPSTLFPISYPINVSPNFKTNLMYLWLRSLEHKTKKKRTRIVCKLLDLNKREFLPGFEGTPDPSKFCSHVQKGSRYQTIDELIRIDMDEITTDTVIVFEVERTSRTKGTVHQSSYSILPIFGQFQTVLRVDPETADPLKIPLYKPTSNEMTASVYVDLHNSGRVYQNSGSIYINSLPISTKYASQPSVMALTNWKTSKSEVLAKPPTFLRELLSINPPSVTTVFLHRILIPLGELMVEDGPLKETALEVFMKLIEYIDGSRSTVLQHFFEQFLITKFSRENPHLARLYEPMIAHLLETLPQDYMDNSNIKIDKFKSVCRCLPYVLNATSRALKLSRELNIEVDDSTFVSSLKEIHSRLCKLIEASNKMIIINKSFVYRSYPMLSDIITVTFERKSAVELISNFLKAVAKDAPSSNKKRFYRKFAATSQFFKTESNRAAVLPLLFEGAQSDGDFTDLIRPVVISSFFVAMEGSCNFGKGLSLFANFIEDFLGRRPRPNAPVDIPRFRKELSTIPTGNSEFLITFLYFCDIETLAEAILKSDNPAVLYWRLLCMVTNVLGSSPPPHIFFICPLAFVNLASLSKDSRFQFTLSELPELVPMISEVYNSFLNGLAAYPQTDKEYFKRVYSVNLSPVAALLPDLLKKVSPEKRFSTALFIPLFHFFLKQADENARSSIIDAFKLLVSTELETLGQLQRLEGAVAYALDKVSTDLKNTKEICDLFRAVRTSFPSHNEFFDKLERLGLFMHDLSTISKENDMHEDKVTDALTGILDSFAGETLFPHFASLLFDYHLHIKNDVEAAELISLVLPFYREGSVIKVAPESFGLPEQSANERRLALLDKAFNLFVKAGFYERALDMLEELKELAHKCPRTLARITRLQSETLTKVYQGERNQPNMFYGVTFYNDEKYGPEKTFIYRRGGFFRNDEMIRKLQEQYPGATVSPKPPENKSSKHIHVFNVRPADQVAFDPYLPSSEILVKQFTNCKQFYSEVPIRIRLPDKKYGEFAEWHRHRVIYDIPIALQAHVRRAAVTYKSDIIVQTPIECAILDTSGKTFELAQKASYYWRCLRYDIEYNPAGVSQFSMLISGIVNAAVNGGTKVFQDLFLVSELKDEENNKKHAQALRDAFADQIKTVNFAVLIHENVVSEAFIPLHMNIVESYETMKKEMETVLGKVDLQEKCTFGELPPVDFLLEAEEENEYMRDQ